MYNITPVVLKYQLQPWESHPRNDARLWTRAFLMDKSILRHRSSLENHLIGDDHIPMDPRDLFICAGQVLFPSIWAEREQENRLSCPFPSLKRKSKHPTY